MSFGTRYHSNMSNNGVYIAISHRTGLLHLEIHRIRSHECYPESDVIDIQYYNTITRGENASSVSVIFSPPVRMRGFRPITL